MKRFKLFLCVSAAIGMMGISYAKDYGDIEKATTINSGNHTADSIDIGNKKAVTINGGKLTVDGDVEMYDQSKINNNSGATLHITGGVNSYAKAIFTNNGTLTIDGTFTNAEDNNSTSQFINTGNAILGAIENSTTVNNSGTLTVLESITNADVWENDSGKLKQSSFTNSGTLNINGDLTNGSGAKFSNSSNITINGVLSNSANYEYTDDNDNEKTIKTVFTNTSTITIEGEDAEFSNEAAITGDGGKLILTGGAEGSNSGTINQSSITVDNASSLEENSGTLNITTLNISGAIFDKVTDPEDEPDVLVEASSVNNSGLINASNINNDGILTNSGKSSWELITTEDDDGNVLKATQSETKGGIITKTLTNGINAEITNSGYIKATTLTNNGSIQNDGADELTEGISFEPNEDDKAKPLNERTIYGGLDVDNLVNSKTGNITGEGTLRIKTGSNEGSIEQNTIKISSNFTNNGTLISNDAFENTGNITGTGKLVLGGIFEEEEEGDEGEEPVTPTEPVDPENPDNPDVPVEPEKPIQNINKGSITQDIIMVEGEFINDGKITSNGRFYTDEDGEIVGGFTNTNTISGTGSLSIVDGINDKGTIEQNAITISGNFENTGDITANEKFNNSGNIKGAGDLILNAASTNTGSINQSTINVNGNLTNNGTITSTKELIANSAITGTGSLIIADGQNNKSITQNNITINGTFDNKGALTANNLLTNNDTIANSGSITAANFNNTEDGEITGEGSLTIKQNGSNYGTIQQKTLTNDGSFTNNNSIVVTEMNNNKEFINSSELEAVNIVNKGSFNNNGSLVATELNNSKNFNNYSEITAENIVNSGTFINAGKDATLTVSNLTNSNVFGLTNNSDITLKSLTNTGTVNIESSTLTVSEAAANSGTINLSNSSALNIAQQTDAIAGTINVDGGNNTLSVADAGISGKLNIGATVPATLNFTSGKINDAATVNLAQNSNLAINGGDVNLNKNDSWNGSIKLTNGSLLLTDTKSNGQLLATGGNLSLGKGSNLTIGSDSYITDKVVTTVGSDSNLNIYGGSVTLGKDSQWTGTITLGADTNDTTSTLIVNMTSEEMGGLKANSGNLTVSGANLVIGKGSYINKEVALQTSGNITVNGGNVAIDNNDTLTGDAAFKLNDGTLNYGKTSNAQALISAEKGNLNLLEGSQLTISAGSKIKEAVALDIQKDSVVTLNGKSELNLDSKDTWNGFIKNNGATITANKVTNSSGLLNQQSGTLNLNGSNITFNNNSLIEGGTVDLSGKSSLTIGSGSSISNAVTTRIGSDSVLNITNGGSFSLNDGDRWQGTINLDATNTNAVSKLEVNMSTGDMGTLHANSGELKVLGGNLIIGKGSNIDKAVKLETQGNITIRDGGTVAINNNDIMKEGAAFNIKGGTLEYNKSTSLGSEAIINAESGKLSLLEGSNLTIGKGSNISDAVSLEIQQGSVVTLSENLSLNLDSKDNWNGHINNNGGTISAKGITRAAGSLSQQNGELRLENGSRISLGENSLIDGGKIDIKDGSSLTINNTAMTSGNLQIDSNSALNIVSAQDGVISLQTLTATGVKNEDGSIKTPLVNVMNSQMNTVNIGTLKVENQVSFNIDIFGRNNEGTNTDKFVIENIDGDKVIRVNDWRLNGDLNGKDAPVKKHVKLIGAFVDKDGKPIDAKVETTKKSHLTPIGYYRLRNGARAGNLSLDLVGYNSQAFRGQVATVAQWMNQLSIDDMLFTHSMVIPSFKEREAQKTANKIAAVGPLFAPYQEPKADSGIWMKSYGTFEHLEMNNGLKRVGNNAYGTLVGADLGLKELKNGWKFMPTAYFGYNGAHQYWSKVSQYQNGGQIGLLGTWYKDKFIIGALAYGGVYSNSMDVGGHSDETFNYFAGAAAKASYNWRLHRDFVIQPNLMAAYNYFGQQNWHTNFGQMSMMSGMLHGINVAPGVNLIWQKETFSAYLTFQYMYNVYGYCGGRAGGVDMPHLDMERGYFQYGIGFTKNFTDRASGYLQAVLRNVGRTGVGFQAGFIYRIGKKH